MRLFRRLLVSSAGAFLEAFFKPGTHQCKVAAMTGALVCSAEGSKNWTRCRTAEVRITAILPVGLTLLLLGPVPAGATSLGEEALYRDYNRVLSQYVSPEGLVDYASLKVGRLPLDHFVKGLESVDPATWEQAAQIAFWVNAYNALTLRVVIDNYPIRAGFFNSLLYPSNSIRQIDGVWTDIQFQVAGQVLTLDQIEHSILRRHFQEPRIHMALVCAALGCPDLRREAYTGPNLERQLEDQVSRFLSDESQLQIDKGQRKVYLSSIFQWFGRDFVSTSLPPPGSFPGHSDQVRAVLQFIASRVEEEKRNFLRSGDFRVSYLEYDWTLNEQ